MPIIYFQQRFVPLILDGTKKHTIRRTDKGLKIGSTLYMQTGNRYKPETVNRFAVKKVARVRKIILCHESLSVNIGLEWFNFADDDLFRFAQNDGFKDYAELKEFFIKMYGISREIFCCSGYLVLWEPPDNI